MGGVLVIEWSENIENCLPENSIRVSISKNDNENERIITLERGQTVKILALDSSAKPQAPR